MEAYVGIDAEPGSHERLFKMLKGRGVQTFLTLGGHDVVCRSPSCRDLNKYRKFIESILFTTDNGKPIVSNTSSYIILDKVGSKTEEKPTAFCFIRSGKLASRKMYEETIQNVYKISSVLAVSFVIGLFDLVCEIRTKNISELKHAVIEILSTPGVSSRAVMVCMTLGVGGVK